jgi:hypothetical protein
LGEEELGGGDGLEEVGLAEGIRLGEDGEGEGVGVVLGGGSVGGAEEGEQDGAAGGGGVGAGEAEEGFELGSAFFQGLASGERAEIESDGAEKKGDERHHKDELDEGERGPGLALERSGPW